MRVLRQQDDAGVGRVGVSVSERNSKNALLSKALPFANKKKAFGFLGQRLRRRRLPTFPHGIAVSSALVSLTSQFGMV